MTEFSGREVARHIELAWFTADATRPDIEKLCAEAREKNFHGVCVNGSRVELARALLEETEVQVVALVGFPLGAADSDAKRYEVEIAVDHGAHELDFVINIGRLKDGDRGYLLREMRDLVEAADERPVKAVLETHLLTRLEKILACELAADSGVRFIANSADFHAPAVTIEEVSLLREMVGETIGVKAAGGIRDERTALSMLDAGATRIGMARDLAISRD